MSDIQIITSCWIVVIIYILVLLRNLYVGKYKSEINMCGSLVVVAHTCCITLCIVALNICPIGTINFIKSIL